MGWASKHSAYCRENGGKDKPPAEAVKRIGGDESEKRTMGVTHDGRTSGREGGGREGGRETGKNQNYPDTNKTACRMPSGGDDDQTPMLANEGQSHFRSFVCYSPADDKGRKTLKLRNFHRKLAS